MSRYFEQTHLLRVENVDINGEWRIGEIFNALQAAAEGQSELFGLGLEAMRAQNIAWVVTRARLTLTRSLRLGETVTLRTWPAPHRHLFFPRNFQLFAQGEPVGSAVMLYVQLDLSTRRMGKPWLGGHAAPVCDLPPPLPLPGGIPIFDVNGRLQKTLITSSSGGVVQIELEGVKKGVYFIQLALPGKEAVVRKLVKM